MYFDFDFNRLAWFARCDSQDRATSPKIFAQSRVHLLCVRLTSRASQIGQVEVVVYTESPVLSKEDCYVCSVLVAWIEGYPG